MSARTAEDLPVEAGVNEPETATARMRTRVERAAQDYATLSAAAELVDALSNTAGRRAGRLP